MEVKIIKHSQTFFITIILIATLMFCLFGFMFLSKTVSDRVIQTNGTTTYQENKVSKLEKQMEREPIRAFIIGTDAVASYLVKYKIN